MTTAATSSQANDLHGFLPKSNPERPFCRIPRQPFRELNSTIGHLAIEAELTETGTATYCSKQESSARTKVKPVQSTSADDQGHGGVTVLTCANQSSPFGSTRVNSSCMVVGCNCSSADVFLLSDNNQRSFEENSTTTAQNNKREMVKRSVSAVGELTGRIGQSTQSTVHASCISGQRLAEWKAPPPSRYDDVRDEFIAKRMSLVEQRSRTPSGKIHPESRNVPESPTREHHAAVLGGPSYVGQEAKTPTDRCPLIELDRSINSYDNAAAAAAAENSIGGIRAHPGKSSLGPPTGGRSLISSAADPLPISARVDGEPASQPNTPRGVVDAKKKKWFTALRIRIPENDDGGVGPKLNLKKLSAADERKIEAALELAGTFSRLGTFDRCPSTPRTPTPRTPGAASRESKESLASNNSNSDSSSSSSPTSSSSSSAHFRFSFSKARKEDRKSSADARLASRLTDPDGLLTPEALEAYDRLVARRWDGGGGSELLSSAAKRIDRLLPKQTTTRRSSLRGTVLGRISYRTNNSFSESDKDGVPGAEEEAVVPAKTGSDGTPKRNRRRGRRRRTLTEPNPFSWFDRNPLNKAKSEHQQQQQQQQQKEGRPSSFHLDARCAGGAGLGPFPLSMPPALDPGIQLPPRTGRTARNSTEGTITRRPPPPPPSTPPPPPIGGGGGGEESDSTPPAIPPRIPHRHSVAAARPKVHQHSRNHPTKPRSYSDHAITVSSPAGSHAASRLTEAGDSPSPSPSPVHRSLDGSNDCVFVYGGHVVPRSPPPPPPPHPPHPPVRRPPLAPGGSVRSSPKGGFGVAPCRSTSVRDVKVKDPGTSSKNKNDPLFREKSVGPELLSECHSETDLLREAHTPIPGCYETSDSISYEDLMEFALDGPRYEDRINAVDSTVCDEIRLMRKMFSNEVSVEGCMEALVETGWNINHAVKLIKLKQLLGSGLGTQDQCKDALMASNWNVGEAVTLLLPPGPLPPPQQK